MRLLNGSREILPSPKCYPGTRIHTSLIRTVQCGLLYGIRETIITKEFEALEAKPVPATDVINTKNAPHPHPPEQKYHTFISVCSSTLHTDMKSNWHLF